MAQPATGPIMAHSTRSIYPASETASDADGLQRASWLEVDLAAIRRNAELLQAAAGVPIIAMVKADGYGCGAVEVARALSPMGERLWGFGVASVREAAALRDAGIAARILCFTPLVPDDFEGARRLDVRPALHRDADIRAWGATGAPWHLSIDTGMSRAGVRWDEVERLVPAMATSVPEGVFTHFHSSELHDGSQEAQEARFDDALALLRSRGVLPDAVLLHRDNSAGIASRARARTASPGALARSGIGVYGALVSESLGLEQTIHLRARVVDVRDVHAGETVSYSAAWTATATRRIATTAVGYGDGYRRALSGRGVALLRGEPVPVVGMITMDMTMIDVTGLACEVGDTVTFIGRDGARCLTTDEVAARGELSPYELLVGMGLRLPRVYRASTTERDSDEG